MGKRGKIGIAFLILAFSLGSVLVPVIMYLLQWIPGLKHFRLLNILAYIVVAWLMLSLLVSPLLGIRRIRSLAGLGFHFHYTQIIWGIFFYLASLVYFDLINQFLDAVGFPKWPDTVIAKVPGTNWEWVVWILFVLTAPFCEEIIFRGYGISTLREAWGEKWMAMGVSSVSYALFHLPGFGLRGTVAIGLWGLGLSLLFVWRKSIIPGLIAHFLNNAIFYTLLAPRLFSREG